MLRGWLRANDFSVAWKGPNATQGGWFMASRKRSNSRRPSSERFGLFDSILHHKIRLSQLRQCNCIGVSVLEIQSSGRELLRMMSKMFGRCNDIWERVGAVCGTGGWMHIAEVLRSDRLQG